MPVPIRLSLATLVLAALLLARPPTADADTEPRTDAVTAYSSASASLVSPYHPLGEGSSLSTTKLVGLIVACFVPALVLVLRERSAERER